MGIVFISYRRGDSAGFAGRLHESLEERLGRDVVFRDVDTIEPGQDFANAIRERLRDCAVLLAVIGGEWLDARDASGTRRLDSPADYVRLEIGAALARADVLVIPVLVEGAVMPRADQLPEVLRPLAQRQALALYDEDWDSGVDRLATAIRNAGVKDRIDRPVPPAGSRPLAPWLRIGLPAVALVVLVALGWLLFGRERTNTRRETPGRSEGTAATVEGASGPPLDVAVPRVCEVIDGDLAYSVISASVTPRGADQDVRVRIRVANDGRYSANFWDASFRLALPDGTVVAPHSGLNEIAEGHSVRDAVVAFTIPARTTRAALRIATRSSPGEIPLDLGSAAAPARDEHADAGDVLARAIVRPVLSESRALLNRGGYDITLTRVLARRFANAIRLIVSVRYSNHTGYSIGAGALTLRAAVADQVLAPVSAPEHVIENAASASGDYLFDLPATADRVTLRASVENASTSVTFELWPDGTR